MKPSLHPKRSLREHSRFEIANVHFKAGLVDPKSQACAALKPLGACAHP
jgi:hypothetical protein